MILAFQKYQDQGKPERDFALGFHWPTGQDLIGGLGLPGARNDHYQEARNAVLTAAYYLAGKTGRWISYSRRRAFYAARHRYHVSRLFDHAGPDGDGGKLAVAIKEAAVSFYGTAFVQALSTEGLEKITADIQAAQAALTERIVRGAKNGQAFALGWTSRDLFGLAQAPDKPGPNYERLSRYDQTGLIWLLQGRRVVALTKDTAAIETATGTVCYRRYSKPTPGPLGKNLDHMGSHP
jgi:hypothetical protein